MAKNKIAIILFNLGGPDSLKSVRKFLFNLFYDPAIISLPNPFRWLLAHFISGSRYKSSQKLYALIGGKSSIIEETTKQADYLKTFLNKSSDNDYEVFISMRYFKPRSSDVIKRLEKYNPDEVVLLPLYPQFSTTTTDSSIKEFLYNLQNSQIANVPIKTICCYNKDRDFINAHIGLIKEHLFKHTDNTRILFSAHGLPQKIIDDGDPYQFQIEQTVSLIMDELTPLHQNIEHKICYQSKVGPMKWLTPNTEDEIRLAKNDKKDLIVVPIAFVSEHVETLVELDIEYKAIADKLGVNYSRVPTLGVNNDFIKSLSNQVFAASNFENGQISPLDSKKTCAKKFSRCLCNVNY